MCDYAHACQIAIYTSNRLFSILLLLIHRVYLDYKIKLVDINTLSKMCMAMTSVATATNQILKPLIDKQIGASFV